MYIAAVKRIKSEANWWRNYRDMAGAPPLYMLQDGFLDISAVSCPFLIMLALLETSNLVHSNEPSHTLIGPVDAEIPISALPRALEERV